MVEVTREHAPEKPVVPRTREPIGMRGVEPAMVRPAMSAADEARRKELMERGAQSVEERDELTKLNEMGDVPPALTAEGRARLDFLWNKAPLSPEEQAHLTRLQARHADERVAFAPAEQHDLDLLMAKGPRTKEEDAEMKLLHKALNDRKDYEEEKRAMEEKAAAGPFSVEQWRHLTAYIERAVQNRHAYAGRVPA